MADIGVETTMNIIEALRKRVKKEHIVDPQAIRGLLIEEITAILEENAEEQQDIPSPTIMLVIGVNGVGKTTTIGKLAHNFKEHNIHCSFYPNIRHNQDFFQFFKQIFINFCESA